MLRFLMTVMAFLAIGGLSSASSVDTNDLRLHANQLRDYLMKQPIQRDILLGEGSGDWKSGCSVYTASSPYPHRDSGELAKNYEVVDWLVKVYEELGTTGQPVQYELQQWYIHLAWIYENCVEIDPPRITTEEDGDLTPKVPSKTWGLHRAFALYSLANLEPAAQRVANKIASTYWKLFVTEGDDQALEKVLSWLAHAGVDRKEIDQRREQLKSQRPKAKSPGPKGPMIAGGQTAL